MKKGHILGYDMNEKNCQISFYDESKDEPETMDASADNYQIPLVIGYFRDNWIYGREARRLATVSAGDYTVSDLFGRAARREKVSLAGRTYDAVWLLAKFVELTLAQFEKIEFLTFTVPETDIDMSKMLKGIGQHLDIPKSRICVQDYKESFCRYMIFQPKELWQYESALFYCDDEQMKAYMLRKLNTSPRQGEYFVTVDEVANAHMKELAALYPIISEEKIKDADESFKSMIENVFEKKVVSSVYLTGEGFEQSWYPNSLKVLCNGRRAFMGNNLYSKGACYTSMCRAMEREEGPTYLDETRLMERIALRMRVNGKEGWQPLVSWGAHWYEADGQWEVLLEDTSDIEILIESLTGDEMRVEKVSLEGLPLRRDYSLRLQIEVRFLDENTCKLIFKDTGFGEFFPATDFSVEKEIHLGGTNGQFNSMSQ